MIKEKKIDTVMPIHDYLCHRFVKFQGNLKKKISFGCLIWQSYEYLSSMNYQIRKNKSHSNRTRATLNAHTKHVLSVIG